MDTDFRKKVESLSETGWHLPSIRKRRTSVYIGQPIFSLLICVGAPSSKNRVKNRGRRRERERGRGVSSIFKTRSWYWQTWSPPPEYVLETPALRTYEIESNLLTCRL